ncbi:MAG: aldo/keto reductase [Chloroflexota bacterium]|nr:aldo/keto reductase [Chloroflexota bacterium]
MIAGRATPEGTRRRAGDRPGYRRLGKTELTVSVVGFGGYRTGRADPDHREALRAALAAGVNLIDTSSNYMLGDSERLVGEVLAEGAIPRDEVVVVTKVGYVQGPNLDLAREQEAAGRPFPEMVKYMDGCWHCIHPEFLEDQLGRALDRLGLATVDGLLLHNPEYFLSDAAHHADARPIEETRAEFYDRLRRAFAYLDGAVADGRIGWYGVSSNTSVRPADDPEATSVADMHAASGERMAVLQLPYNLLETGALLEPNTPDGTALDAARARDLGVLVNRPLNAMDRGQLGGRGRLIRLADPPRPSEPGSDETLRARVGALLSLEGLLAEAFPEVNGPRVAPLLLERWDEIGFPQAWAQIFRHEMIPEARRGLGALVSWLGQRPDADRVGLLQAYQDALNGLVEPLQARATRQPPEVAARIRQAVEPHLPPELRRESLSRIALDFVVSTPGVTCALNGMRHPAYVEDAVGVLGLPAISDVVVVARALA